MRTQKIATMTATALFVSALSTNVYAGGASGASGGVKVYGHLNVSTDFSSSDTKTKGRGHVKSVNVSNNHSYLGVKGFEAMPGSTKAIFQIELGLPGGATASPTPENNFKANGSVYLDDTFVGVRNPNYGTFLLIPSGEAQAATVQRPFNIFKDTVGDYNALLLSFAGISKSPGINKGFDQLTLAAQTNWAPLYETPRFYGFDFEASTTLEGGTSEYYHDYYNGNSQINNSKLGWTASIDYKNTFNSLNSKFHANVSYTGVKLPNQNDIHDVFGAASWLYKPTGTEMLTTVERTFGVIYRTAFNVSLKQSLPYDNDLKFGYTHAYNIGYDLSKLQRFTVNNSSANSFAVGVTHHFNQKVSAYLDYDRTVNSKNANYFVGSLYHGDSIRPQSGGANPQSLSVGMIVNF